MLMQPTQSGKSFTLSLDLNEYPWARMMKPDISILLWNMNQNGAFELTYKKSVVVQTFISTNNDRFIHVIPRTNATPEDIEQVFKYMEQYVESLNDPRSCEVDPHTGQYPVNIDNDNDFW